MSFLSDVVGSFAASNPIGGLLSAAGSIFGGLFGKKGQDDANATNLQIARETNEANRANQEYQNEWNLDMWNRQNEYNSPLEQRRRLEQAGLNPIFFGLDGTGNAGSLQSAPFQAQIGAPMLNSGQFMGSGLSNAMTNYANTSKTLADADLSKQNAVEKRFENFIKKANVGSYMEMPGLTVEIMKSDKMLKTQLAGEAFEKANLAYQQFKNLRQDYDYVSKYFSMEELRNTIQNWCDVAKIDNERAKIFVDTICRFYQLQQDDRRIGLQERIGQSQIDYYDELTTGLKWDNRLKESEDFWREVRTPYFDRNLSDDHRMNFYHNWMQIKHGKSHDYKMVHFYDTNAFKEMNSVEDTWQTIRHNRSLIQKQDAYYETDKLFNYINTSVGMLPNLIYQPYK